MIRFLKKLMMGYCRIHLREYDGDECPECKYNLP